MFIPSLVKIGEKEVTKTMRHIQDKKEKVPGLFPLAQTKPLECSRR